MDRPQFEKLEKFNIGYDILIDEEDAGAIQAQLSLSHQDLGESLELAALMGLLRKTSLTAKVACPGFETAVTLDSPDPLERSWAALLIAKRLRGRLQTQKEIPPHAMIRLGEYVIRSLTALELEAEQLGAGLGHEGRKTLHVLLLNEACACYKHDLSVGFGQQVLTSIALWQKEETGEAGDGQNVYELLALLNKGVGYLHLHQHTLALKCFDDVIEAIDNWRKNQYDAGAGEDYRCGKLPFSDLDELKSLWRRYVFAPAVVYKAEVLSDLNRSTEQLPLLSRLTEQVGDYWPKRATLLVALAKLDGDLWEGSDQSIPEISGIREWDDAHLSGRQGLRQKRSQVLMKYGIEDVRRQCRPRDDKMPRYPTGPIRSLFDELARFERASKRAGEVETKDACRLWIDYYHDLVTGVSQFDGKHIRKRDVDKVCSIASDYFAKRGWFPDEDKSRDRLLTVLEKMCERLESLEKLGGVPARLVSAKADLAQAESAVLERVLVDSGAPRWRKAKAARRLQRLGQPHSVESRIWRLPDEDERNDVAKFGRDIFCDQEECEDFDPPKACAQGKKCRACTYQHVLEKNKKEFQRQLVEPSIQPISGAYCLTVLRRWQSFTPVLSTGARSDSRGGGYFVYKTDERGCVEEGIAVDPGFDFIENFLRQGFSVRDIRAVVMTHAHPDHTADFLSLVTLFVEYGKAVKQHNKRNPGSAERSRDLLPEKKLLAVMSAGCFERLEKALEGSREYFSDIVVASTRGSTSGSSQPGWSDRLDQLRHFRIHAYPALHDDTTASDSIGVVLSKKRARGGTPLVGFTGDTMWWSGIHSQYEKVPVLCANLGGIVPVGKRGSTIWSMLFSQERIEDIVYQENHLYWPGFALLTGRLGDATRLVVVTELGEELKGGLKTDMVRRLNEKEPNRAFLPEDIGLTVKLEKQPEVHCLVCKRTVSPQEVRFRSHGHEESTYYFCKSCEEFRSDAVADAISECDDDGAGCSG